MFVWAWMHVRCAENMLAFTAKQEKGLTSWKHADRHERMQKSFLLFDGHEKHTNKNLHSALMPLCLVRNWHKGQNWKAWVVRFVYTDLGFWFWLTEQEIQTCRFNSVLKKDTVIVLSFKTKSSCFFFFYCPFLYAFFALLTSEICSIS